MRFSEYAHVTAGVVWNQLTLHSFLSGLGYAQSEYTEALADIIAVAALINSGKVSNTTMCASVSQLWCGSDASAALSPFFNVPTGSHPPVNARGNRLCKFIQRYYA